MVMIPRLDALEKVTGRAIYTRDIVLPDLLYGKILRSSVPHARILSIDVQRAVKLPGVRTVLTYGDLKHLDAQLGTSIKDQPLLAFGTVRYAGEAVAAIAAETEVIAEEALGLINVAYEDLPAVTDIESAMSRDATLVHPGLKDYSIGGAKPVPDTNILHVAGFDVGDVDAAIRNADVVVENEFRFPMIYHYAVEPHCAIARFNAEEIIVWSSTQSPFTIRDSVARIFRVPVNRVRVVVPYVGGGFGSKSQSYPLEPLTVALSRETGRPVKTSYSVTEAMLTTRRLGMYCRIRTAANRDGTLVARDCAMYLDNGAYAMIAPTITEKAANRVIGPYRFPNLRVKAHALYTNTVPAGSFRAVGAPQAVWAGESQIDILAEKLKIDPLEFRKLNVLRRGESPRPGMSPLDADLRAMIDRAANVIEWKKSADRPNQAKGMAIALSDPGAAPPSIALARFNGDGSLTILSGSTEIGQGSKTVLSQIAAAEMEIPLEKVFVAPTDTLSGPFDPRTSSSRTTTVAGSAVQEAVRDVKRQLLEMAAEAWGKDAGSLQWSQGKIGDGGRWVPGEEVIGHTFGRDGGEVIGKGVIIPGKGIDKGSGRPMFYESCLGMAEVEVDGETGQIKILRYIGVSDIGKAINLAQCEGQEEGALMQGIGHTLFEEMVYVDGTLINNSLVDYRVPNFLDLPQEEHSIFIENEDGPGPGGAKGMGEGGIIPVAAAIENAVSKITGVRITDLPLRPDRVWRRRRNQETGKKNN
jgi:CO/xanthine dehydrogenase Mo-binding subunit